MTPAFRSATVSVITEAMATDFVSYIDALSARLQEPLPGIAAQREMAPVGRLDGEYDPFPSGARQAAVLVLLWPCNSHRVALPLIARPEDGTVHSGQVAFPGGHREPADRYPVDTAMREAEEELGVSPGAQRLVGTLTPLFIPVSNVVVMPVVTAAPAPPPVAPSAEEVSAVHVIELDRLPRSRSLQQFLTPRGLLVAPCYRLEEIVIWGATAMILSELSWLHRDALAGSPAAGLQP